MKTWKGNHASSKSAVTAAARVPLQRQQRVTMLKTLNSAVTATVLTSADTALLLQIYSTTFTDIQHYFCRCSTILCRYTTLLLQIYTTFTDIQHYFCRYSTTFTDIQHYFCRCSTILSRYNTTFTDIQNYFCRYSTTFTDTILCTVFNNYTLPH